MARYTLSEATVGAASDSDDGGDHHLSDSDDEKNDESVNEYDHNDSFIASEDDESVVVSTNIRPLLSNDIREDKEDMEDALANAESIRKRCKADKERQFQSKTSANLVAAAVALKLPQRGGTMCSKTQTTFKAKSIVSVNESSCNSHSTTTTHPVVNAFSTQLHSTAKTSAMTAAPLVSETVVLPSTLPLPTTLKRQKTLAPEKPTTMGGMGAPMTKKSKLHRSYFYRIEFTDGVNARKFLDVVASAVTEMRFHVSTEKNFMGLRLEAHDSNWHTAIRSQIECSVTAGDRADGTAASLDDLNGMSFTVSAARFMTALDCAILKDTTLSLTRYHAQVKDEITFEAITNEDDVRTAYSAPLVASPDTQLGSLSSVVVELGFHVNVNIDVLQKLTGIAKKCGASTMRFEVHQAIDTNDAALLHSRMRVGFEDFGGHDFFLTARKSENDWLPVTGPNEDERRVIAYSLKSANDYDASKLRLFVSKLSTDWVLVHLSNCSAIKPMVMECTMGGEKTSHAIMIAPREK